MEKSENTTKTTAQSTDAKASQTRNVNAPKNRRQLGKTSSSQQPAKKTSNVTNRNQVKETISKPIDKKSLKLEKLKLKLNSKQEELKEKENHIKDLELSAQETEINIVGLIRNKGNKKTKKQLKSRLKKTVKEIQREAKNREKIEKKISQRSKKINRLSEKIPA